MAGITLEGKRILITGAARGLGAAYAKAAVEAGATVVIADILEELGAATAKSIGAHFVPVDLASAPSIAACVEAAAKHLGGIDGLVNNGAIATGGGKPLEDIDLESWDKMMAVNVRSVWLMARAALPHLKQCGTGKIVNVASDVVHWGPERAMLYTTTKGAVLGMTRSMARELGHYGIAVNAIAPGLTLVEATASMPKARHELAVDMRAIQRSQMPEDLTGTIVFLLSDAASFLAGQQIVVNGGFTMI